MKEETIRWLEFAKEDLKVAQIIFKENIHNQVCFHAQQAAEKSLKALIEEKEKVPKEHRLPKLCIIALGLGYDLEPLRERLEFLDKFYTSTRYPFIIGMLAHGFPLREDASLALAYAEEIYEFVCNSLKIKKNF